MAGRPDALFVLAAPFAHAVHVATIRPPEARVCQTARSGATRVPLLAYPWRSTGGTSGGHPQGYGIGNLGKDGEIQISARTWMDTAGQVACYPRCVLKIKEVLF